MLASLQASSDAVAQARGEAAQAVREARQEIRDAQQEVRDAQREVRNAQREVRNAHTTEQRSDANDDLQSAQEELRVAESELRRLQGQPPSIPMVYVGSPPGSHRPGIPAGATDIAIGFFITCAVILVGWPISRILGRRIERGGGGQLVDAGLTDRLERLEQAVEAVAVEVERISESQRYLAKIQAR